MNKIKTIGNVIASLILLILMMVGCAASAERAKNSKNVATQCITNGGAMDRVSKGILYLRRGKMIPNPQKIKP